MNKQRIQELRKELESERISTSELLEIEQAFDKLPDESLRDDRDNATASDMLDELESLRLCKVCGDFQPRYEFEISQDVCKWCDVTVRETL